MRPVRDITAEEENFRLEGRGHVRVIRRDPIEPEPVGTIVLMAFRVTGYDRDCDGSLMARLAAIDEGGDETGWRPRNLGLCPDTALVATADELRGMFGEPKP